MAKYATKGAEDFGLGPSTLDQYTAGEKRLSDHAQCMITAALDLASQSGYERLARWTHVYGFRGHFATHSRRYSTTLTALRNARAEYQRPPRPEQQRQRRG